MSELIQGEMSIEKGKGSRIEPWVAPTFGIWAKEEEKPPSRWKGNQEFVGPRKSRGENIEKEGVANCVDCPLMYMRSMYCIWNIEIIGV